MSKIKLYHVNRISIKQKEICNLEWLRIYPWTARRSNQSILKEINHEYSLEGLMLKLKVQYFSHLMQRADALEKTLRLGKTEGRRRVQQKTRWLDGITNSRHEFEQALGHGEGQGSLACCSPWGHKESDTTERLNNNRISQLRHKNKTLWKKKLVN